MVNILSRLTRKVASPGSAIEPNASNSNAPAPEQNMKRTASTASPKRLRHASADRPSTRRLLVISDTADFDRNTTHRLQADGFDATFIGFVCSGDSERDLRELENAVLEKEDELEPGERYAIVAYNRPAYYLLALHHLATSNTNPFPRLCALIAYYPLISTDQWTQDSHASILLNGPGCTVTASIFDSGPATGRLPIQIHLPGHEAKPTTVWPWIGLSPSDAAETYKKPHRCYVYAYPDAKPGFAERDIDPERGRVLHDQDQASREVAWSRTLRCLRRAFGVGYNWAVADIEIVWEEYWRRVLGDLERRQSGEDVREEGRRVEEQKDSDTSGAALEMMVSRGEKRDWSSSEKMDSHGNQDPSVECVPTGGGGTNIPTLRSFFANTFIPNGPPSQRIQLLSRTVGPDRIVDEILFSFRHTAEVPWLLPGVLPTDREIHVRIVIVASFCGSKIVHQSLYWDQASVLIQAGLLDEGFVPRASIGGKE